MVNRIHLFSSRIEHHRKQSGRVHNSYLIGTYLSGVELGDKGEWKEEKM